MTTKSDVVVQIDPNACVGSGSCQMVAAAVFDMTPDGVVALRVGTGLVEISANLADQVREAEASCPAQAIAVTEKSGVDR